MKCSKCKKSGEFNKGQKYCKSCQREYQQRYYTQNKKQFVANVIKNHKRRKQHNVERAKEYLLLHPCVDCGNKDIRVLHFDHVSGKKHANVTTMIQKGLPWDSIAKEIRKCEIRCANCHMIRTWPTRWENNVTLLCTNQHQ